MVIQKISVRRCDRCGTEPAEQCTIATPENGRRFVDLCAKHRGVLNELADEGTRADKRRTPSYTREQVARMEEAASKKKKPRTK